MSVIEMSVGNQGKDTTGPTLGTNADQERRRAPSDRRRINYAGIVELFDQVDHKHDEAHRRLRADFRELEQQMGDGIKALAEKQHAMNARITELATTPVDVTKLMLSTKIVVSIIFIVVGIAGGMWASTSGLRSGIDAISAQIKADQRVADERAQRAADNNAALKEAIATVTKRQELLTLQYNQLNDQLTRLTAQRGR